jgi:hypothetical protein
MPRVFPRPSDAITFHGWRVDDCRGHRLGTLASVYEDPETATPAWFLVRLGRYSTRFVLTPPAEVLAWQGRLSLPYERLRIERAPLLYAIPPEITPAMEAELRRHYCLATASDVGMTARRSVV